MSRPHNLASVLASAVIAVTASLLVPSWSAAASALDGERAWSRPAAREAWIVSFVGFDEVVAAIATATASPTSATNPVRLEPSPGERILARAWWFVPPTLAYGGDALLQQSALDLLGAIREMPRAPPARGQIEVLQRLSWLIGWAVFDPWIERARVRGSLATRGAREVDAVACAALPWEGPFTVRGVVDDMEIRQALRDSERALYPARSHKGPSTLEVTRRLASHLDELRDCVEAEPEVEGCCSGRVVYEWVIGADGHVTDIRVERSELSSVSLMTCMSDVLKSITYSEGGGEITVVYPFHIGRRSEFVP